ncbi:hypothetical protein CDL12_13483 [Handroanthus impetiginosus]|uniref:Trichome birefringence-like C-terminal domain-containing protein n=1 Tax=Handroanthus impetiginosus TaxID=429701 RepID=A0A2G9H8M9_9LAMI|nr:hypothetical protein CDL12_13483 [Handroanthus impetiginosus]
MVFSLLSLHLVSVVWSHYLMKAVTFEDNNGVSTGINRLHLDEPDTLWTRQYENFDYVVVAGEKWFLKSALYFENNTLVGCHYCLDTNTTELGFEYAYRKALNSTLTFMTGSKHKPVVVFRTMAPDHFEKGEWNTGGYCNRTRPFKTGEIEIKDVDDIMHRIELEEFERLKAINGISLKLLDATYLSLLRPDGHPGAYRQFQPFAGKDKNSKIQHDCLHWCLPGPIDSWNDLILEMFVKDSN